ncbi:MAG: holin [Bilifractor sp.]|jgi:hypothetical protein
MKIFTKQWFKATAIRMIKTFAQAFVATIGTAAVMSDVDWRMCLSASVLAAVLSFATSLAGLPEVSEGGDDNGNSK